MIKIKSFRNFTEGRVNELVTIFCQCEPPTIEHGILLDKVVELAKGKTYQIYASQSEDPKTNPLIYEDKIKFMRKMFPSYGRNILIDHNIKNVFDIATKAYDSGFSKLTLVVESNRISEFKKLLDKNHAIKGDHGYYEFKDGIDVKSGNKSKVDTTTILSSNMREAAASNDIDTFKKGLPVTFNESLELFNAVRKGMGLKESVSEIKPIIVDKVISEQRERYIDGSLFKIGTTVYTDKNPGMKYIVNERHSNYVVCSDQSNGNTKFFIQDLYEEA